MNQPGSGEVGRVAVASSNGKLRYEDGLEAGSRLTSDVDAPHVWHQKRFWITPDVDLTGVQDATSRILAALNARVGGCVHLPDGVIRMNSGLTVPAASALVGNPRGMRQGSRVFSPLTQAGTLIKAYGTGTLFTFSQQATIEGLEIWYPNQATNAAPTTYDYTFRIPANQHFCSLLSCSVLNPHKLVLVEGNGVLIDGIVSYPLFRGVNLGRVADVARVQNVHFIPTVIASEIGATLQSYVQGNATAFLIDGAEEFAFTDCFAYGYDNGIEFHDEDGDGFRGCYGSWKGGGLDIMNRCIRVREPNGLTLRGLKLSDCGLVPNGASAQAIQFVDTHVPANPDERPAIYATNVAVWNGMDRAVWLVTGSYGVYTQTQGSMRGMVNQGGFAQSANSVLHFDHVCMPTGATRTGGAGTIVDVNQINL